MSNTTIAIAEGRQEVFIVVDGKPTREVHLSPKEYDILLALTKSGQTMGRDLLGKVIWGKKKMDTRTIDQHIARLRRKLKVRVIDTVPGRGYKVAHTPIGE